MTTTLPVKNFMTPFPHTVDLDTPITEARQLMLDQSIRHLPVKNEQGELIGVVTDRDIKLVLGPYLNAPQLDGVLVRHVCVLEGYTADLSTPVAAVVEDMVERHIGSALITKKGRLAGIFTLVDAGRLLAAFLRDRLPAGGDAA